MMKVTKEEVLEWNHHPVTQALLKNLKQDGSKLMFEAKTSALVDGDRPRSLLLISEGIERAIHIIQTLDSNKEVCE